MPPMDGEGEQPSGGLDGELADVMDSLGDKQKDAVLKYARSLSDEDLKNDNEGDMPPMQESKSIIDEVISEILKKDYDSDEPRFEKRLPKKMRSRKNNPFISNL